MSFLEIITWVFGFAGSGFGLYGLITVEAQKRKAEAEANKVREEVKTNEIENVTSAIKIWREMAEEMAARVDALSKEVAKLHKEVSRLSSINNKIVKLLDRMTPENMEDVVKRIKELNYELNEDRTDAGSAVGADGV